MLEIIRRGKDAPEPGWGDAKWTYAFIVGGLVFGTVDIAWGARPGALAGWLLGFGLGSLMIQVPIARVLWRCQRLVRAADGKGAFDADATAPTA